MDKLTSELGRRGFLRLAGASALAWGVTGGAGLRTSFAEDSSDDDDADEKIPNPLPVLNIRSYGAKGDGKTNDTDAFARAAADLNAFGQGTLLIPAGTYIVGRQTFAGARGLGYAYRADPILHITNCPGRIVIRGLSDRAVLKAADNLKFGAFDPVTGLRVDLPLPLYDHDYQANAYQGMIWLEGNSSVSIRNLQLNGNSDRLTLGGEWGDTGRQCGASGIWAMGNTNVTIRSVRTHHHGLDGVLVGNGNLQPTDVRPHTLVNVVSEYNARDGLSWVGGSGLKVRESVFSHTGRGAFFSAPGSGVDIEPEDSHMQGGVFEECEFKNNVRTAVVCDRPASSPTSSVRDVTFRECRFGATTYFSMVLSNTTDFKFENCSVIGSMVVRSDPSAPAASTQFLNCRITDDQPTAYSSGYLVDSAYGYNVLMDGCTVKATKQHLGNFSYGQFANSTFIAGMPTASMAPDYFVAVFYFGSVVNCTFQDLLPSTSGPRLTINYGANPVFSGNQITTAGARLVLLAV